MLVLCICYLFRQLQKGHTYPVETRYAWTYVGLFSFIALIVFWITPLRDLKLWWFCCLGVTFALTAYFSSDLAQRKHHWRFRHGLSSHSVCNSTVF